MTTQKESLYYTVSGARRFSNYFWGSLMFIGGIGFLAVGSLSALNINDQLFIFKAPNIQFIPQGLVMCFYGLIGLLLGIYIWLTIIWNLGHGYNEFNLKTDEVRVFRWGFPGNNRRIDLRYPIKDVQSIRVEIKEGINTKRAIFLKLRGNREIPLIGAGQPMSIQEIETQATDIAKLLKVSLEISELTS